MSYCTTSVLCWSIKGQIPTYSCLIYRRPKTRKYNVLLSKQKFMTSDQQSMLFIYYSQVRAKCVFLLHVSTCTTTIYINIFCILQNALIFACHVLCDSDSVSEYSHRIFCRTLRVYCRATSDPWGIKQKTDLRIRPSLLVYCSPE